MRATTVLRLAVLIISALLASAATAEAQAQGELGCADGGGENCRPPAGAGAPVDDLAAALARLAGAPDATVAADARAEALAILEGTPIAGRAYSGIPLLNWNAPAKVLTVPAGEPVEIREVRFPGHALTDAWLLEFDDPSQPYTIRYRITELGGTMGGELKPAALLAGGAASTHEALLPLVPPPLTTGALVSNRFTDERGLTDKLDPGDGLPETTRLAEQVIEVRMPAPGVTRGILHPSGGPYTPAAATTPRPPALFTLQPATDDRRAAAAAALGFDSATPSPAEREQAIEQLAVTAPERQIWDGLRALPEATAPGFADSVRELEPLVDAMRTRDALPFGTAAASDADVTVVFQNNETYVSQPRLRPEADRPLRVHVVNRDGFAHGFSGIALRDRVQVQTLGAEDWGRFSWKPLDGAKVPAGGQATVDLSLPAAAFAVWLGDADTGDQASSVVELEQGPRVQSVAPTPDVAAGPLHQAMDASGRLWITLSGVDALVGLTPAADLESSTRTVHLIPNGRHDGSSQQPPLEPSDVAVDHRGVVWTTLALGNGIARLDPARAAHDTAAGMKVYALPPCGDDECPVPFPPEPGAGPTRQPLQMEVTEDARGNTLVWFTESNVDRIGLLRVAPDGTQLGQTHFSCGCRVPFGLALDQDGDVWFTEGVSNRIGRLTPDVSEPYAAAGATLRHYRIPSGIMVNEPELGPAPDPTSVPHSVTIDRRGLVWFTESATGKMGWLDPERAVPGTTQGIGEILLPTTDFGTAPTPADLVVDRAGTVFWSDEYGDIVGTVETAGPASEWAPGRSLRPAARRSLTDSPLVDPAGALWYIESAANRMTRVEGVSAGNPRVAPRAEVDVSAAADTIAIRGLDEASAVDVRVMRAGSVVAQVNAVPFVDGTARVTAWPSSDALRSGDVVRVSPRGPHLQAAFSTVVPTLQAGVTGGAVRGEATLRGRPLPGVVVAGDGREAALSATGAFAFTGTPETVSWVAATPGARWRFHARVTLPPSAPPEPSTPEEPVTPPAGPAPPADPPAPTPPVVTPPVVTPPVDTPACPANWLGDGRPVFLGMRAAELADCLGRPVARSGANRRYARGLVLEIRRGSVTAMTLRQPGWTSDSGGLGVGAPRRAVARALPGARLDARLGVRRAVVALGAGGRVADVRVHVRAGRVERIEARATTAARLDRFGRALLAAAR
jgi:streptogramin lyase